MLPYQERVVAERNDLENKINKLVRFIESTLFSTLPIDEQDRLKRQFVVMRQYCMILDERIKSF